MPQVTFRDVYYSNAKSLCKCLVEKGMNLEKAFEAVCSLITCIEKQINLDAVNLKALGLEDNCEACDAVLGKVLNSIIKNNADIKTQISGFTQLVNNINQNIGLLKDELVKVDSGDIAGYLKDKFATNQPGSITVTSDFKIFFTGFVPIGAQMIISKTRIGDFDATGKGKANTDVYGYAISNGQNNTTNRLGVFSKYVPANAIATAGTKAGENIIKIAANNIPSLSLPVTGTIEQGLGPVQPVIRIETNKMNDGAGGNTNLMRHTPNGNGGSMQPGDVLQLGHAHAFNLNAEFINTDPKTIAIIPEHILEIPIERITI